MVNKITFKFAAATAQGLFTKSRIALLALAPMLGWGGLLMLMAWGFSAEPSKKAHRLLLRMLFNSSLAWVLPATAAFLMVSSGALMPPDDLLRHLSAWELGFDYRRQYPWSDLPAHSYWLGYEVALGLIQALGVSRETTLLLVVGAALFLNARILHALVSRSVPAHRRNFVVSLLLFSLAMLLTTERTILARPELFYLLLGACAWLVRGPWSLAAWVVGSVCFIPTYWLGWVYAPFALVIAPQVLSLKCRVVLMGSITVLHLGFWQWYTGDYLGQLTWLKSTLTVQANENRPMVAALSGAAALLTLLGSAFMLSLWMRRPSLERSLRGLKRYAPAIVLSVWFMLPDQMRYLPALAYVLLPSMTRTFTALVAANKWRLVGPLAPAVAIALFIATLPGQLPSFTPQEKVRLPSNARVLSQQPYAAVFYGQTGIAVEPSFALGATRYMWSDILKGGTLDCDRVMAGRFTHVFENSLREIPTCLTLSQVYGEYRLWEVR